MEETRNDVCGESADICGEEAGCHPLEGSGYVCLCTHDLLPPGLNNSCDRSKGPPLPDSAGAPFHSHQLRDMLTPPRTEKDDMNMTVVTTSLTGASRSVAVACFVLLLLGAAVGGIIFWLYLRRKKSLKKCMQKYVANPNYYSLAVKDLEIDHESVQLLEEIGEGFFGKVYKGFHVTSSGSRLPVAVKTLKSEEALGDFEREVDIMSSFCHDNILKLLGVVIRENCAPPWMVFEFMKYGDLSQVLRNISPIRMELNQDELVWISRQIASGMFYLSSQHFIHRDLATRNCLVGDNLAIKISDFGLSRDIYTSDYYKVGGSRMLPVRWMAPESIMYGKFSLQSDIWSYGVVLWEIFTNAKQPYYGHSNEEVVKLIVEGILLSAPDKCPPFVCSLMAGCWKTEPRDRITFGYILEKFTQNSPL